MGKAYLLCEALGVLGAGDSCSGELEEEEQRRLRRRSTAKSRARFFARWGPRRSASLPEEVPSTTASHLSVHLPVQPYYATAVCLKAEENEASKQPSEQAQNALSREQQRGGSRLQLIATRSFLVHPKSSLPTNPNPLKRLDEREPGSRVRQRWDRAGRAKHARVLGVISGLDANLGFEELSSFLDNPVAAPEKAWVSLGSAREGGDALLRLCRAELLEEDPGGVTEEGVLELLARLPVLRSNLAVDDEEEDRRDVRVATWVSPGRGRRQRSQRLRSRRRYRAVMYRSGRPRVGGEQENVQSRKPGWCIPGNRVDASVVRSFEVAFTEELTGVFALGYEKITTLQTRARQLSTRSESLDAYAHPLFS